MTEGEKKVVEMRELGVEPGDRREWGVYYQKEDGPIANEKKKVPKDKGRKSKRFGDSQGRSMVTAGRSFVRMKNRHQQREKSGKRDGGKLDDERERRALMVPRTDRDQF